MKIGYLGAGTWGFCLASLLASKGHEVVLWAQREDFAKHLSKKREHPKLANYRAEEGLQFTSNLEEALVGIDFLVESVSSSGVRPVLEQVLAAGGVKCPIIITSKGIEQNSCLLLPEVVLEVFGLGFRKLVGVLSGPSHAEEVIQKLPTSIVCSAYESTLAIQIQ